MMQGLADIELILVDATVIASSTAMTERIRINVAFSAFAEELESMGDRPKMDN